MMVELYSDPEANHVGIMSIFAESRSGRAFAYVFTIVVALTIFGSVFSVLCGFGYLPYAAAKDGTFFQIFAHESTRFPGLADYSLGAVCLLSAVWCFFSLDLVVNAMTTMIVLIMFVGQSVGLLYYRYTVPKEEQQPGWRMPLFPLPCIIQIVIFLFIWISTDSVLLWGSEDPILELSMGFIFVGPMLFLVRARLRNDWPFTDDADDEQLPMTVHKSNPAPHEVHSSYQGDQQPVGHEALDLSQLELEFEDGPVNECDDSFSGAREFHQHNTQTHPEVGSVTSGRQAYDAVVTQDAIHRLRRTDPITISVSDETIKVVSSSTCTDFSADHGHEMIDEQSSTPVPSEMGSASGVLNTSSDVASSEQGSLHADDGIVAVSALGVEAKEKLDVRIDQCGNGMPNSLLVGLVSKTFIDGFDHARIDRVE
jgi:hypothetical protein